MYSMPQRYSGHDLEHLVGPHADHPLSTTQQHVAWENNWLRVECNLVHHLQTLEDRQAVRIMPAVESYYAAVVVPLASDNRFHLVGRYRYAVDGWSLEFPRFDLETGDDGWKDAAGADLLRIAGLKAERLVLLGALQIDPALLSTSAVVVLAEGCCPAASTKLPTATGTAARRYAEQNEPDDLIAGTLSASSAELAQLIRGGHVSCGVTLGALSLYRALVP